MEVYFYTSIGSGIFILCGLFKIYIKFRPFLKLRRNHVYTSYDFIIILMEIVYYMNFLRVLAKVRRYNYLQRYNDVNSIFKHIRKIV